MDYKFDVPTKLFVGEGCSAQLGANIAASGAGRVMLVFDKGVEMAGLVGPVVENLKAAGLSVDTFNGVMPDPPMEIVEAGTALAKKTNPDAFVALGGGSSIDAAKAINANWANPGKLKDHAINLNGLKVLPFEKPLKPFYAVPTTAGTGSEISSSAIVTDHELKLKVSVMSPSLAPTMSFVDPALMTGLPPQITASTGLDAFAHALEGLMGGLTRFCPSPMRDSFALTAIELIVKSLIAAIKDGNNMQARSDMAYAAFLSIMGASSGLSMGHSVGHAISEVSNIHNHGFLCASILPNNIEFMAEFIPDQLEKLARIFKVETKGKSTAEIGGDVKKAIKLFFRECGLPSLKEMGMKLSDVDEIVKHTTSGTWYVLAPKKPTEEELAAWLKEAFEG